MISLNYIHFWKGNWRQVCRNNFFYAVIELCANAFGSNGALKSYICVILGLKNVGGVSIQLECVLGEEYKIMIFVFDIESK